MIDRTKLAKLKTASQLFDETIGLSGTPAREEFHANALAWYYGEILRDRRKSLKMTQQQLADKVNVPRSYISKIERGENDMQLSSFLRIAGALGLNLQLQ